MKGLALLSSPRESERKGNTELKVDGLVRSKLESRKMSGMFSLDGEGGFVGISLGGEPDFLEGEGRGEGVVSRELNCGDKDAEDPHMFLL